MAIKSDTRERYEKFINGLLLSLSMTEYSDYPMTDKVKEFKLIPVVAKVLEEQKYITRRKILGNSSKYEYKALKKPKDVDPKHVLALIKRCNNFYYKPKPQAKGTIKTSALLNTMQSIVKEAHGMGEAITKVIYRKKNDHGVQYEDAQKFIADVMAKKISAFDFEEHRLIHSPRSILIEKITGNGVVTVNAINVAKSFHEVLVMLSKEDSGNGFKQKLNNLKQDAKRAPKNVEGNMRRANLPKDMCQLYIDYKKVPGARFAHKDLYNRMLAEQKGKK